MELVLLAQKSQPAEVTRSTTEKKSIHHRECDVDTVINSLLGSVLHQKCTLKGQLSVSNQLHHSESHPGDVIWKYVLLLPYLNYSSGWVTRPWMFISINTQSSDLCCRGSFLQNYPVIPKVRSSIPLCYYISVLQNRFFWTHFSLWILAARAERRWLLQTTL